MSKYKLKEQKPWICSSTGSGTNNAKNNSESIGDPANSITLINGLNIIRLNIINMYVNNFLLHI